MYDYDTKNYGYNQDQERNARAIQSMNPGGDKEKDIKGFETLRDQKKQSLKEYKDKLAKGQKLSEADVKIMHRLERIVANLTETINIEKERLEIIKRAKHFNVK